MSRRTVTSMAEAPGQDSFLDVVANLVGIFLILIIIVGSQAKTAVDAAREAQAAPGSANAISANAHDAELREKLKQAESDARTTVRDLESLQEKLTANQFELAYRRKELEQSTLQIELAKKQLEAEQSRLSQTERDSVSAQVELKTLQDKQKDLESEIARLLNAPTNVEVVENLPSPKVQKASVDEVHFQLKNGRLLYIPMMEIQKDAVKDIERAAHSYEETTRSMGPLHGFRIHYRIYTDGKEVVDSNGARGVMTRRELDMQLEPVDELMGEPVAEALQANSDLFRRLRDHPSTTATVTLWVYPDSFGHFRKLRDALYKQGYLVAARPMPEGEPIGCSTKGNRSIGQ
jgi:hypothetical protein